MTHISFYLYLYIYVYRLVSKLEEGYIGEKHILIGINVQKRISGGLWVSLVIDI